jgi:hypothetical protein
VIDGRRLLRSVFQLTTAAAFLAERHSTDVGYAKIIEDARADLPVTCPSREHLVRTTVAFALT